MLAYTAKRLIGTVPVLLLITLLVFAMMHAAPGDPATMLVNEEATFSGGNCRGPGTMGPRPADARAIPALHRPPH